MPLKKILFIDHDPGESGSSVSLKYIIDAFINRGLNVAVLTPRKDLVQLPNNDQHTRYISGRVGNINSLWLHLHFTNEFKLFSAKSFGLIFQNIIRCLLGLFRCYITIKKYDPDLVYLNEYVSLHCLIPAKILKRRTAVHIRSPFIKGTFGFRRHVLNYCITKFSDLVIGITRFEINQIRSNETFKKKCFVIGEFLDDDNYSDSDIAKSTVPDFGLPDNLLSVVSVGGIQPIKGTKEYLLAAKMVLQTNTNVCFVLAGRGDTTDLRYYNECNELISELQLTGRFFVPGVVRDIVSLLKRTYVLVSTNTVTHFSRPVIEAWAQKKPVIISDVEHGKLLVSDGVDGLIYSKDSPDSLALKINHLVNDRALAGRLAENGFKKAIEYYHARKNTDLIYSKCELLTEK